MEPFQFVHLQQYFRMLPAFIRSNGRFVMVSYKVPYPEREYSPHLCCNLFVKSCISFIMLRVHSQLDRQHPCREAKQIFLSNFSISSRGIFFFVEGPHRYLLCPRPLLDQHSIYERKFDTRLSAKWFYLDVILIVYVARRWELCSYE